MILKSYDMHSKMQNIESIGIDEGNMLTVCGDTHGQFYDVRCSVLQCVAVCCSVLQCLAVSCRVAV